MFKPLIEMKHIIVLGILIFTFACGSHKESTHETEAIEEEIIDANDTSENYRVVGIVHVSETECPLYIEAREKDKTINLYPMNLDEKYKKEGMKLKFEYAISKGAMPANCNADLVVSLTDVTLMR